jgi:hypothetical protein
MQLLNPTAEAQAAEIVNQCRPLKELRLLFPSRAASLEYFAQKLSDDYSSARPCCVICQRESDSVITEFHWVANINNFKTVVISFLATLILVFLRLSYSRFIVIQFKTFHRICENCQRGHRIRSLYLKLAQAPLFVSLIVSLLITIPSVVFLGASFFIAHDLIWKALATSLIGGSLLIFTVWGFEACRKFSVPRRLRHIGQSPFFLHSMRQLNVKS